jgi:hypothetical protein
MKLDDERSTSLSEGLNVSNANGALSNVFGAHGNLVPKSEVHYPQQPISESHIHLWWSLLYYK